MEKLAVERLPAELEKVLLEKKYPCIGVKSKKTANKAVIWVILTPESKLRKEVAIKDFELGYTGTAAVAINRQRALTEYDIMEMLKGVPQIAESYGTLEYTHLEYQHFCILMEYGGENLNDYLLRCKEFIGYQEKINICYQLAKGLDHIQQKKSSHGDIKLDNVTINKGIIKIIDFGISTEMVGTKTFTVESLANKIKGYSHFYAPPEVLEGKPWILEKVDPYCFGKLLYQVMNNISMGELEGFVKSYASQTSAVSWTCNKEDYKNNFVPKLNQKIPNDPSTGIFSKIYSRILKKCLAFDPNERPTFAQIVKEMLPLTLPVDEVPDEDVKDRGYTESEELYFFNQHSMKLFRLAPMFREESDYELKGSKNVEAKALGFVKDLSTFATITTPNNKRIFLIGGMEGEATSNKIYEIDPKNPKIVQADKTLLTARTNASLVANCSCVFILGGEASGMNYLDSCEEYNYEKKTVKPLPPMSERKSIMAACTFRSKIYVFGGELEYDFDSDSPNKKLLHNYSNKVEFLDLDNLDKWETIKLDKESLASWGGCGQSAAIPIGDSIMIIGGFFIDEKRDYNYEVKKCHFDPKKGFKDFSTVEEYRVEFLVNNSYRLKNDVLIACSTFPKRDNYQVFLCQNMKDNEWKTHCLSY